MVFKILYKLVKIIPVEVLAVEHYRISLDKVFNLEFSVGNISIILIFISKLAQMLPTQKS